MLFALSPAGVPTLTRIVESANPEALQKRINAVLAELADTVISILGVEVRPFVTSIDLAGGGDGHTFVATIVASPAAFNGPLGALDPQGATVRCIAVRGTRKSPAARSGRSRSGSVFRGVSERGRKRRHPLHGRHHHR